MSISRKGERPAGKKIMPNGTSLEIDKVIDAPDATGVKTFAKVTLGVGGEIAFHTHVGESEGYYILSGTGEYNDNGKIIEVKAGDYTYTPSGSGHGIKNIGYGTLEFMALIVVQ